MAKNRLKVNVIAYLLSFTFLFDLPAFASNTFVPPSNGAPGRRQDAGSRPGCPQPKGSFTALVPATNWGKTASKHPTFWLYVPYPSGQIELALEDERTKEKIYHTTFQVTQGLGIINYSLPETAPALAMGKQYRWRFFFFCNPEKKTDLLAVDGVILREEPSNLLLNELEKASPSQRFSLYAKNGFWHDALTELAQVYQRDRTNAIATEWVNLLNHPIVRLNHLASQPFINCCTPN